MSNKYIEYDLPLTENQLEKIKHAIQNKKPIGLKFTKQTLNQNENLSKLLLTKTQINKIEKHKASNSGVEIKLSLSQLKKNQSGGFLPLLPLLAKAATIAAPLAISAVSGLINGASNAIGNKIVGKGSKEDDQLSLNISKQDLQSLLNMVEVLESKSILPGGSSTAINQNVEQRGGSFVVPLIASLLGTFLPTLFKGKGIYLPWESKN